VIRPINPADPGIAPRLLEVQHRAYAVEAALIGFDGIPPLQEDLAGLMASTEHWLGCFTDDVLVAAVAYQIPDHETLDITRLVVDPSHARKGHATALLDALDDLEPRGLSLVATGTANAPAIKLYLARGYHEFEQLEVGPGIGITRFRRERVL
jgi:ribosomal protein S18 acetylase RimI-like enzyme